MPHLPDSLVSHVAMWKQLHLNQLFAMTRRKGLWKMSLKTGF
jgi:hypothetical protein